MTINQLSIFMENRSGTLIKALELMKKSKIQIIASTIADTAEYGIYRIICSEPSRAYKELKEAGVAVALSDVFALELDDEPAERERNSGFPDQRQRTCPRSDHPEQPEVHFRK